MAKISLGDVTMVIPTHNRPVHVSRLLDYYSAYAPQMPIAVADSSEAPLPRLPMRADDPITYLHLPGQAYLLKMRKVLDQITTPFVVLCADDYLILPSAIQCCCLFLAEHEDFSALEGLGIALTRLAGRNFYTTYAREGLTFRLSATSSLGRLDELLDPTRYYAFFYSCQRTEATRRAFSILEASDLSNPYLIEYAYISLLAIAGKAAVLPILYSLITGFVFSRPRPYANIHFITKERGPEFMRATDSLSRELARMDGMTPENGRAEILRLFDRFDAPASSRATVKGGTPVRDLFVRAFEKPFYALGREDALRHVVHFCHGCREVILGPPRTKRVLQERLGISLDDPRTRESLDHLAEHLTRRPRQTHYAV